MSNITSEFNGALKPHGASLGSGQNPSKTDQFLTEAYELNTQIATLYSYLRSVRQSYLSTSLAPKRPQRYWNDLAGYDQYPSKERQYLTDPQRDEIDAESKKCLRMYNQQIQILATAEQLRIKYDERMAEKTRGGLNVIGRWAAGGSLQEKSQTEKLDDVRMKSVRMHRESVLWYLTRKLEECGQLHANMVQIRLEREVEKSKSILYKTQTASSHVKGPAIAEGYRGMNKHGNVETNEKRKLAAHLNEEEKGYIEQQLNPEQLQLFAQENQSMLKHYEDTLDQVKTAERSLYEISQLQTTLASNLATQSAHIDQLVADSLTTAENVVSGNKELKKATERKSTAKYTFYAVCSFSLLMIIYDLVI
ncbi:MAG: hypothetical protein M1829_006697 [Trizodia sp. TS-e1964]|nr:MAG: hypothetical protein M1829_006697 [Trizodia sp. TS-e1964]